MPYFATLERLDSAYPKEITFDFSLLRMSSSSPRGEQDDRKGLQRYKAA